MIRIITADVELRGVLSDRSGLQSVHQGETSCLAAPSEASAATRVSGRTTSGCAQTVDLPHSRGSSIMAVARLPNVIAWCGGL